ncbi:MAG: hypothetical protein QM820_20095 [Minicystis sp.]
MLPEGPGFGGAAGGCAVVGCGVPNAGVAAASVRRGSGGFGATVGGAGVPAAGDGALAPGWVALAEPGIVTPPAAGAAPLGAGTWMPTRGTGGAGRGGPPGSAEPVVPPGSVLARRCGIGETAGAPLGAGLSHSSSAGIAED